MPGIMQDISLFSQPSISEVPLEQYNVDDDENAQKFLQFHNVPYLHRKRTMTI